MEEGSVMNWMKLETKEKLHSMLLNKVFGRALLLGYAAVGVSIAMFVRADILSAYPWARTFVDAMGAVIPAIEKLGHFSKLPELAQFHMTVMWVLSPVIILPITLGQWIQPRAEWGKFFQEARTHRFRTLLSLIVMPLFFMALYILSPGESPGIQLSAYLGSRLGLAIWTLLVMGIFLFFSLWLGMLKVIKPLLMTIFLRSSGGIQLDAPSSFNKGE